MRKSSAARRGIAAGLLTLAAALAFSLTRARADNVVDTSESRAPGETAERERLPEHVNRSASLVMREGERLVYDVYLAGVLAGRGTFTVKRRLRHGNAGPWVYDVRYRARSNAFTSVFYKVENHARSLIDAEGTFSRYFELIQHEGRVHAQEKTEFDYERREASYEYESIGWIENKVRQKVVPLPERIDKVQDPLSCLYALRHHRLEPGGEVRMTVSTDRRNWPVTVRALRREDKEVAGLGELATLVVEPEVPFPGLFVRKGRMTVWLEERTKIPVEMKVDIPIGSAHVVLVEAENSLLNGPAEPARSAEPEGEKAP